MAFQRFTPHRYLGSGTTRRLQDFTPVIPSFLRKEQGDAILGIDDASFTYPNSFGPLVFLRIFLDISVLTGPRLANTDLTDKFEQNGWIVLRELGTTNKFQVAVSSASVLGRQTEEPYEYYFADLDGSTISTEFRAFTTALQGNNYVLELWDEEPSDDPEPEPTPDPGPSGGASETVEWPVLLHDVLQHTPILDANMRSILRERVFPDVLPEGKDFTKPHMVWYETGVSQTIGVEGSFETGVRVTLDFRSPNRLECQRLRKASINLLKIAGVVDRVVNISALYDFETKIRREIVDVVINPFIDSQANPITRLSPWDFQFSGNFG